MLVKGITDEDFVNYKLPSMFIATPICSFKCEKECGVRCCQNSALVKQKNWEIDTEAVIKRYLRNKITKAIVFGGLEPLDRPFDVLEFLSKLRILYKCDDPVVIYTGYYPDELPRFMGKFKEYKNVVMKFGRYIPGQEPHFDEVLGVNLASDNQYGEVIS